MIGIILADGNSKRFKYDQSKVFYKFKGKELIKYVVEAMNPFVDKMVVVTGKDSKNVKETLKDYDNISYVKQEKPLGTGNALLVTETLLKNKKEDLLVSFADKPLVTKNTFRRLINKYLETNAEVVIGTAILKDPLKKGRIIRKNGKFVGVIEYRDATEEQRKIKEVNSGFLCVKSENLFQELKKIDNNNSAKEYYLTDIYANYIKDDFKVETVLVDGKESFDVNTLEHMVLIDKRDV